MAKGLKVGDIENSEILLAVGFCKLLAVRIADKPRRLRVLDVINYNPGCDADKINELYFKKYGEKLASSTLSGDLQLLVEYGLCDTEHFGRKKFYEASGFLRKLCKLAEKLEKKQNLDMPSKIAMVMKG